MTVSMMSDIMFEILAELNVPKLGNLLCIGNWKK